MNTAGSSTDPLAAVRIKISACIQCGTCTGSCPNEFAMDVTPRYLWRQVLAGETREIFLSQTFLMCSSCYSCTLRCPRGLPLTEAMSDLKQIGLKLGFTNKTASAMFYRQFLKSIRRHGRVHEMEMMSAWFWAMKNPMLPLRFSSLGLRLMSRGKVSLMGSSGSKTDLSALFRRVAALEQGG
jgi:heterodisulfide reductase subunit C